MSSHHYTRHRENVGELSVADPDAYVSKKRLMTELEAGNGKDSEKGVAVQAQTFLERIDHLTWPWFAWTMSTGGLALLLAQQPHNFNGLFTIGKVVFIFDLVVFATLTLLITTRFVRGGGKRLMSSLTNPTESLFAPCFLLSLATIIPCSWLYGYLSCGPWLAVAVRVLFWIYVGLSITLAVSQYSLLFSGVQLTFHSMNPAWILPIFPCMLSGTVAGFIAGANQPPSQALPIVVAGITLQGLGFWIAIMMQAILILRLMQDGFPSPDLRPGLFVAVGPPSFTAVAVLTNSQAIPANYSYLSLHPEQAQVFVTIGLTFSIFIWTLAFFLFCISFVACVMGASKQSFHLVMYSWIFPNVGFCLAMIQIGMQLNSQGILYVASVFTAVLFGVYFFVLACHIRAVVKKEILWQGRDEDRDS